MKAIEVGALPSLETLNLRGYDEYCDELMPSLVSAWRAGRLSNLRHFYLDFPRERESGIRSLIETWVEMDDLKLVTLSLEYLTKDGDIDHLFKSIIMQRLLPNVRRLHLGIDCRISSPYFFKVLDSRWAATLQSLSLGPFGEFRKHDDRVHIRLLAALQQGKFPCLTSLDLSHLSISTPRVVPALCSPSLASLVSL